jgi:hypothetical protein
MSAELAVEDAAATKAKPLMKKKSGVLEITPVIPCATANAAERITKDIENSVRVPGVATVTRFSATDLDKACNKAGWKEAEDRNRYKTWGYEELETQ